MPLWMRIAAGLGAIGVLSGVGAGGWASERPTAGMVPAAASADPPSLPDRGLGSPMAPGWDRVVPPVGPAYGTYAWPVAGLILRPFEPPASPFGPGHRGIDIGSPQGTPVRASASGEVAFAGRIAGSLFLSIDHVDGVRTTYSWLSEVLVSRGDAVARGAIVAATGGGHPGSEPAHHHFGARLGDVYLDPLLLLERPSVFGWVHLAPLARPEASPPP